MNLVNVAKRLHRTRIDFRSANAMTSSDEKFASQQLFEFLKTYKNSCFSEFCTYETLECNDECDDMSD